MPLLVQKKDSHRGESLKNGAGEEIRTLDSYLGKVVLYQLSYARLKEREMSIETR